MWHPLLYDMFWNSGKQIRPRRLPVRSALLADNSRPPLGWLFYRSTYDYFACRAHFESDQSTSCSAALSQKGTCVQGLIINSCMRWSNNTTLGSSTSLLGTWHASNQARGSTRTHMIRWRETFIIYDAGKITLAEKERKKEWCGEYLSTATGTGSIVLLAPVKGNILVLDHMFDLSSHRDGK